MIGLKRFSHRQYHAIPSLFYFVINSQLSAQTSYKVSNINVVVWYVLASTTDLWQPTESEYRKLLKVLMAQQHNRWLDDGCMIITMLNAGMVKTSHTALQNAEF